jgi:hypothetical protein
LISILFSPARGLFAIMPVFLFSVLGIWKMFQDKTLRREAWVILVIVIGYLMINSGFYGWHGGWTYGPRYLVPMLPFLAIPMIFAPREPLLFGLALFFSVIQITLVAISMPHTSIEITNPLTELVIPLMFEGYLAESWPMWLGLSSAVAMLFYFVICGLLVYLLWRGATKEDGNKTGHISFGFQKGKAKKVAGVQLRNDLVGIRKRITIMNRRVALPIVGWLLIIAFMLNTFHTVPPKTVQYYRDRLLYTLGARDVIHDQVEALAEEYKKSRLRTKSHDEEDSQVIDNERNPS